MYDDKFYVGRVDCTTEAVAFATMEEAETYLNEVLMATDPEGVERGDYYIDPPEDHIIV